MTVVGVARREGASNKRRVPGDDAARVPERDAARFPALDLTRLRPRPLETRPPAGPGRVKPARPLARRTADGDRRLLPWSAGSGAVHALLLFAILYNLTPTGVPSSPEPPTVEMVFGHAGSSGLTGASVPKADQGANAKPTSQPTPQKEELEPPAPLFEAPPAPPLPAMPTLPSPAPAPSPPRQALAQRESRRPSRSAQHPTPSTNPFAHMTNLSLAPSPQVDRAGRGGSASAINLSLGPMVQGGRLAMPFSMHGGHGMSSDYQEMIDDWVEAHKYYPDSAARRGHDGNVSIHVVWNRDGQVLDVQLRSGSGDQDLDDAWTGLFRGAHLPPPPPDVKGDPISMDMTMHFVLTH